MPGLHVLALLKTSEIEAEKNKFLGNLAKMKHYSNYEASVAVSDEKVLIGYSGYEYYPFKYIKSGDIDIAIEGNIYNLSDVEIKATLSKIALDQAELRENVCEFISQAQGEFIVVIYNKVKRTLLVFNDALGRLPIYYYASPQIILVSKEIKFIIPYLTKVTFDKNSLAEYLIFRFPLENKTLIKDICRLPPATMLFVDLNKGVEKIKQILSWNLDSESYDFSNIENTTSNLVSTFLDATKQMSEFSKNKTMVVSLSGGYDSRTVLAGFSRVGAKPIAFTFINDRYKSELPVAKEITRILNIKHEIIPVSNATEYSIKQMQWLAYLKDGLNSVNHFGALEFAQTISNYFKGEIIEFSGQNGDEIIAPLGYNPSINSLKQLVEKIYSTDRRFSLEEVSLLLEMDKNKIRDRFESLLDSYPEKTFEGKFKHFKIFEKVFKWDFEGESRDRFTHWQTTPFLPHKFFAEIMKLPESVKKGRSFYRRFLSRINSECSEVRYDEPRMEKLIYRLSLVLPIPVISFLSKYIKKEMLLGRKKGNINYIKSISNQILDKNRIARDYFNLSNTKTIIDRETSEEKIFILLTILMYMDIVESNVSNFAEGIQHVP